MIRRCISTIHGDEPVEATVFGVFHALAWPAPPQAVRYCETCANMGWDLGLFTPKKGDY